MRREEGKARGRRAEIGGRREDGRPLRSDDGRQNVLEAAHTIESTRLLVISTALNADLYIIAQS